MDQILRRYRQWCTDPYFDADDRAELIQLAGDRQEITDRFYKELEFGTGGMRGVIGIGTNRMNVYTVRKAAQGLAEVILKEHGAQRGTVIAFDSRKLSAQFAMEAALCLCANGIKVWIFEALRPTPELSFAVRELECIAGIVITASHNPAQYNGCKIYWEDGAQVTAPKDREIMERINRITKHSMIKTMSREQAGKEELLQIIGSEMDDKYINAVKSCTMESKAIKAQARNLKIVYTPLHGAGNILVRRILKEMGFEKVYTVLEQEQPDESFSTIACPNPEDPEAFKLARNLAQKVKADLILATDADADRLGVYGYDRRTKTYIPFTGNMSGMLICEYLLSRRKENKDFPADGAVVTTIVSGNMPKAAARAYGARVIETLTGFKYIGEQIKQFEQNHNHTYLFGYEESYGCLIGTYTRDKDAVSAAMMICEAAAYYAGKGFTLWEQMQQLFKKYGYYKEDLITFAFQGKTGEDNMSRVMDKLRKKTPVKLSVWRVTAFYDYKNRIKVDLLKKEHTPITLPKANVLYFELEEDAWLCVRPSGTEPKIKIYTGIKGRNPQDAEVKAQMLKEAAMKLMS